MSERNNSRPRAISRGAIRVGVLALTLIAACVSGCGSSSSTPECTDTNSGQALQVCSTGATVDGIDVSVYQGAVDWASVKSAGKTFAFIRVSDGVNTPDTQFAANWKNAKTAGVIRGIYQFFEPGQDPTKQADLLLSMLADAGDLAVGDLPFVLDVEVTGGVSSATLQANALTWLKYIESKTGMKPFVYTALFMSTSIGTALDGYPLWVANYGVACPNLPAGWSGWQLWQDSSTGSVGTISGNVDTDQFNGSLAELKTLTLQPAVVDGGLSDDAGSGTGAGQGGGQGNAAGAGQPAVAPTAPTPNPCK